MDRGTDAAAVLRNEAVPLRLGYVGVVNRSQHDLNTGIGMAAARSAEAQFFASRPEYHDVSAHAMRRLPCVCVHTNLRMQQPAVHHLLFPRCCQA